MSNDFVLRIAKILLLSSKIFENRTYCIVYSIILIACGVFSILGSISGFLNAVETSEKIVAFVCITAQLNGILLYIAVLVHRNKLLELFNQLEKRQDDSDETFTRAEVFIKNKLIWFFTAVVLTGTLFILPALISTTFEDNFDDKRSLLIPFWFSCGGRDSKKMLCFEVSSSTRIRIQGVNMYQATSLSIHMFAYLLSFTLYGLVAGDFDMHMEIIAKKVNRFNKFAKEVDPNQYEFHTFNPKIIELEEDLYQQFLRIILYQKFIHRCIGDTVSTWILYASHYYGSTFFDVTLFLFGIISLGPEQKLLAFRALGLVIMRLLMALIVAYYSQNISHLNEDFLDIMSRIKWYTRKRKFCQVYHQVLTLHQTSNLMKIAGVVELNLNCYGRLMRNIYSVVNLIYLRYGK